MAKKEPKVKKEKVPKVKKTAKTKKLGKTKINFKNYKATNPMIITTIFTFRIIVIAFLFTYPFLFALTSVFDRGAKQLMMYTVESAPSGINSFFSFGSSVSGNESILRTVPFMLWLLSGMLVFFFYFLPFLNSKSKGAKGFLSFYYLLIGGIGFGLIYGLQFFAIGEMPHSNYDMENWINASQRDLYWKEMSAYFSFDSIWMIMNQIFHGITIVIGLWCAIESDLIRRKKLKYSDLLTNADKSNSLANKVLSGELEFGNVPDENLRLSITKLKNKLSIDAAMTEELNREAYEEGDSRQNEIEMTRSEQEQDHLNKEIKEAV